MKQTCSDCGHKRADHAQVEPYLCSWELCNCPGLQHLLTDQELVVCKLLVTGHTSKWIANKLILSYKTICAHRYNIQVKTRTTNIAELIRYAFIKGIVKFEDYVTENTLSDDIPRPPVQNLKEAFRKSW